MQASAGGMNMEAGAFQVLAFIEGLSVFTELSTAQSESASSEYWKVPGIAGARN